MNKRLHYSYPDANMSEGRVVMYINEEKVYDDNRYHVFKDPECTVEVTPDELNDAIHAGMFIRNIFNGFTNDFSILTSSYGFVTNDDGSLDLICEGLGCTDANNQLSMLSIRSKKHIKKEG